MATTFVEVDVRPILRAGGEPFEKIMEAASALQPGQGLKLFATFKPTALLHVLGSKGFTHEAKELDGGEWEVLFSPSGEPATNAASVGPEPGTKRRGPNLFSISITVILTRPSQW